MRTCLFQIFLIKLLLLKTIFSFSLEEIKIELEAMGIQKNQLNFLEEQLQYDELQDPNFSFEEIVIKKGYFSYLNYYFILKT